MRASWRFFHIFCLHRIFLQWEFSHFLREERNEGIFTFCKYKACLHCEFLHVQQCMKNEWELSTFCIFIVLFSNVNFHMSPKIQRKAEKFSTFSLLDCVQCVLASEWLMKAVTDPVNSQDLSLVWVLLYTFNNLESGWRLFHIDYSHYISLQSEISST